jgi:hypothetical protein
MDIFGQEERTLLVESQSSSVHDVAINSHDDDDDDDSDISDDDIDTTTTTPQATARPGPASVRDTNNNASKRLGPAAGKTFASKVNLLDCRLLTAKTCCNDHVVSFNRHCPCLGLLDPWAMNDERERVYMNRDTTSKETQLGQASRAEVGNPTP